MTFLKDIGHNDVYIIVALLSALAGFYIVSRLWRRHLEQKKNHFLYTLIEHMSGPLEALLAVGLGYSAIRYVNQDWLANVWVSNSLTIAAIASVSWLTARGVKFAASQLLLQYDINKRDNLSARAVHTQIRVIQRIVTAIIIVIGMASSLMVFEEIRALGLSLLASAGVAGIVLGFAAQKTIGNFFTGLQIALTQPIRIDDAVVVEGEWGWIEEINLTYVVVKIWDQRRLILPINYFVENPFQNWTRQTADILGPVKLYLDYSVPINVIREELDRILEGNDMWDGRVNVVQVTDTTEKTIVVRILVSAADSPTVWGLRCHVRERMIEFLNENYPDSLPKVRAESSVTLAEKDV